MTKTMMKILIGAAVAVALVVLFNLLPTGVCIASTISAGVGAVAGWFAKRWYDNNVEHTEEEE